MLRTTGDSGLPPEGMSLVGAELRPLDPASKALPHSFSTMGCGTLLIDKPQKITITSGPPGAKVELDGEDKGVTPIELLLETHKSYEVVVTPTEYPPETRVIKRTLKGWYIVGDIFLLIVPLIVDIATDSLHALEPKKLHFQFEAVEPPPAPVIAPAPSPALAPPAPRVARRTDRAAKSTEYHCCVNRAYYDCPDPAAVARCAPPELAGCLMNCGVMDASCPEDCLSRYPVDPSDCSRDSSRDTRCR